MRLASGQGEASPSLLRIGCVVMASGEGRRFGSQKLLATFAGKTLLEQTLSCIPADIVDAVVVTRSPEVASLCEGLDVRVVLHGGVLQSDTVRCGVDAVGEVPACMFLQGDQPLLTETSMRALVAESRKHPDDIVRLAWRKTPGSPIVFPRQLFDALRAIEGDRGGSALFKTEPALEKCVRLVEAQREWELFDVDTPSDLTRLEAVMNERIQTGSRDVEGA